MEKMNEFNFEERYQAIGLNIAYYRKARKISQLQLAEKIGISRTHVSNWEGANCPTQISLEALFRISQVLDVPVAALLDVRPELNAKT